MRKLLITIIIPIISIYTMNYSSFEDSVSQALNNQWRLCTSKGTGESSEYGTFEATINYAKNLTTGRTLPLLKSVKSGSGKYTAKNVGASGAYPSYIVTYDAYEGTRLRFSGLIYVDIDVNKDCSIHWMGNGVEPWSNSIIIDDE